MLSATILDKNIDKLLHKIKESLDRKYWTSFDYQCTFNKLAEFKNLAKTVYYMRTGEELFDTARRIFINLYDSDLSLFVQYFNLILFATKWEQKLRWHHEYGSFPDED